MRKHLRVDTGEPTKPMICLVSASGGHFEQLKCLAPLIKKYRGFIVTEKTSFGNHADYYVTHTGTGDRGLVVKTIILFCQCCHIWMKKKPDYVITTGTYVSLPFLILCKLCKKRFIYIETFARVTDTTRAGKMMYKYADLFIYQWEQLKVFYPDGIYGGSIY